MVFCISLMTNDIEHLLMCLLAIHLGDPFKCFPLASFLVAEMEFLHTTGLFLLYLPAQVTLESKSKAVYPEKPVGQGRGLQRSM